MISWAPAGANSAQVIAPALFSNSARTQGANSAQGTEFGTEFGCRHRIRLVATTDRIRLVARNLFLRGNLPERRDSTAVATLAARRLVFSSELRGRWLPAHAPVSLARSNTHGLTIQRCTHLGLIMQAR